MTKGNGSGTPDSKAQQSSRGDPAGFVAERPSDPSRPPWTEVESHPGTTIELPGSRKAARLLGRLVGVRDCSFRTDFPKHPQNGNPSSSWCCRGPAVNRERSREGSLAESTVRSPRGSASSCATDSTATTYAAYWRPSEMEEKSSARFSEYLFAKMDGQDVSASQGPRKVTADTRKFMRENLLLVVTLSGVVFGVILGESPAALFLRRKSSPFPQLFPTRLFMGESNFWK